MRYIIVSGYIRSGSSVINNLLKEVEGFKTFDSEFKLFTGFGGIVDLEQALFSNWSPWNCGRAFDEFISFAYDLSEDYKNKFSNSFKDSIDKFTNRVVYKEYLFASSQYREEQSSIKKILFPQLFRQKNSIYRTQIKTVVFSDVEREQFCRAVNMLVDDIFGENSEENIVLDQGLRPYHADLLESFFANGEMFIVDRNPLDSAVSMIENGKGIGAELRINLDAELYVRWVCKQRNYGKKFKSSHVHYYKYEDIVYEYDKCLTEIFDALGVDKSKHIYKGTHFDPQRSYRTIDRWKEYSGGEWSDGTTWNRFCNDVRRIMPNSVWDFQT